MFLLCQHHLSPVNSLPVLRGCMTEINQRPIVHTLPLMRRPIDTGIKRGMVEGRQRKAKSRGKRRDAWHHQLVKREDWQKTRKVVFGFFNPKLMFYMFYCGFKCQSKVLSYLFDHRSLEQLQALLLLAALFKKKILLISIPQYEPNRKGKVLESIWTQHAVFCEQKR